MGNYTGGLASLNYDGGSDAGGGNIPDVGDIVTATSGATGIIEAITVAGGTFAGDDASGVLTLVQTTGCFNDGETITFTDLEVAVVNHPDGAVGADKIIKNGAFVTDIDPPNNWTAMKSADLDTEAGGQVGNCLEINENGESKPYAEQSVTLTIGKIYKVSLYVKEGTGNAWRAFVYGTNLGYLYINPSGSSGDGAGATFVEHTLVFKALDTTINIALQHHCAGAAGTNIYFDEVTLYEILPAWPSQSAGLHLGMGMGLT